MLSSSSSDCDDDFRVEQTRASSYNFSDPEVLLPGWDWEAHQSKSADGLHSENRREKENKSQNQSIPDLSNMSPKKDEATKEETKGGSLFDLDRETFGRLSSPRVKTFRPTHIEGQTF